MTSAIHDDGSSIETVYDSFVLRRKQAVPVGEEAEERRSAAIVTMDSSTVNNHNNFMDDDDDDDDDTSTAATSLAELTTAYSTNGGFQHPHYKKKMMNKSKNNIMEEDETRRRGNTRGGRSNYFSTQFEEVDEDDNDDYYDDDNHQDHDDYYDENSTSISSSVRAIDGNGAANQRHYHSRNRHRQKQPQQYSHAPKKHQYSHNNSSSSSSPSNWMASSSYHSPFARGKTRVAQFATSIFDGVSLKMVILCMLSSALVLRLSAPPSTATPPASSPLSNNDNAAASLYTMGFMRSGDGSILPGGEGGMGMTPGIRDGGGASSDLKDFARMEDYGNGDDSVPFDAASAGGGVGAGMGSYDSTLNANNVPAFSNQGNLHQQQQPQAWSLPNGQQQQQYQVGYAVDPAQKQQQFLGNGNMGLSSSSQQQLSPMEFLQQQQQQAQVMGGGQLDPLQPQQQQQQQQFEGFVGNIAQDGLSAPGGGAVGGGAPSLQQELTSDTQQLEQQQLLQRLQEQEVLLQKLQEQQQQNQPLDDGTSIGVGGASGVGGSDAELVVSNSAASSGLISTGDGSSSLSSSSSVLESLNNFNDSWDPYDPKSVPMFWHIPKAGGSSIKDAMGGCHRFVQATEFGITDGHDADTEVAIVYPAVPGGADTDRSPFVNIDSTTVAGIQRAKKMGFADAQLADVVVSPFVFETNDLFTPTAKGRLFSVFRHPIDRAVSMFYYIRVADWEPSYKPELKDWTLEQYAQSDVVENNWMTRQLSNQLAGDLTETNLNAAMEVVRSKILVGLMSQIEPTMSRFEKFFRWTYHVNPTNQEICRAGLMSGGANSNKKNKKPLQEGDPVWDMLAQQNNFDLQLYNYIETLFIEQEQFVTGLPDNFRNFNATCCKCDPPTYPPEGFTCPVAVKNG